MRRRIHAKRACRCCQTLKQAPAEAEIVDVCCLSVAIELRRIRTQVATASSAGQDGTASRSLELFAIGFPGMNAPGFESQYAK